VTKHTTGEKQKIMTFVIASNCQRSISKQSYKMLIQLPLA